MANDKRPPVENFGMVTRTPAQRLAIPKENPTEEEEADLERLYQRALRGEITVDEAVNQFRAKWYGGKSVDEARREIMTGPPPPLRDTSKQIREIYRTK